MTDNTADNEPIDFPTPDGAQAPGAEGAQGASPDERLAELEAENAELKDRSLRLMADMENLRRRTAREIKDTGQYAISGFAREILGVADNLRRALEAVPDDMANNAEASMAALIEGVQMTERELLNALQKHGIRKIEPEGEKFDPNFHQAMFEVPNPEVASGTVVQIVQPGYVIGERVLRPAMVGVAKGGPKAAKPAEDAEPAAAGPAADDAAGGPAEDISEGAGTGARVNKTA